MKKTKVVFIQNTINPHLSPIWRELAKRCDLTVLFCAKREKNRTWNIVNRGFKSKVLPTHSIVLEGKDLFTYFINLSIFQELKKLQPDVIIIGGWDSFTYQAAFFYAKLFGIKVIIRSGSTKYEPSWRRTITKPLVQFMVRNADALIAYGTRAKEYLIELGAKAENIFISFNTTDIDLYVKTAKSSKVKSRNLRKSLGLGEKVVFMYYGQLIYRKGVDLLLSAYKEIKEEYPQVALLIAGSGKEKTLIEEVIKREKLQDIKIIANPGDGKIGKYYQMADIFVLPSREEVWGLVLNQAMACGLPVIVSDIAGASVDLVINDFNGYTFISEQSSDLAKKMRKLARSSQLRKKMGKRCIEIMEYFLPEKVFEGFKEAIDFSQEEKSLKASLEIEWGKA